MENYWCLTVPVRAMGVLAALLLLLILVVGCGEQSSTESPDPKSEPTTESGPNKREVAIEEGSLRDLVQEQVGDFKLQKVEEPSRFPDPDRVENLEAQYMGSGGAGLGHELATMRSPEAADSTRQQVKNDFLSGDAQLVDERPVEASGRRVGTMTVITAARSKGSGTGVLWNNGNLFAGVTGEESDAVESFYESVPY